MGEGKMDETRELERVESRDSKDEGTCNRLHPSMSGLPGDS